MSETKRVTLKTVSDSEFANIIEAKLEEHFKELHRTNSLQELEHGFLQATVPLTFVVFARKPMSGEEAKTCCKCHYDKHTGALICKGSCCIDVGDGPIIIDPT